MQDLYRMGLAVLAWSAVLLGGCDGAPADKQDAQDQKHASSPGGETSASGCELLTIAEIESALGVSPERAEPGSERIRECNWFTADGLQVVGVNVSVAPSTYEEYMQKARQEMGSDENRVELSRVEGVGDYAVWQPVGKRTGVLSAVQNGTLLVVGLGAEPTGGKSKQEAAAELARKALPRL